ncbi:DUF3298 and DUF4163 domain-containing protein [Mucilaginibacter robiniae]|uniref:DUF3298 and DUF4163 domain-containing protein n=1 Tax=Mucilaginibacter robiniae TaxID=2728022 RepID=A0A7L5EA22_9SPHI|nr:RsiV family protein [Mucilaginibacter robiniae]QJD97753.1 DUF3298 and DUF4163 domain-containing protein [Mucilaginibacter robiniae]
MTIKHLLFILPAIGMSACIQNHAPDVKAAITTDTLTYTYKSVKQKADDCGSKPDKKCTIAYFQYPAFDKAGNLNDSVVTRLALLLDNKRGVAGIQQLTWAFMNDYKAFKQKNPSSNITFEMTGKASVIRQDSSFTSVALTGYLFNGGAHGTSTTHYINWNTKSGKKVTLNDILKPDYQTELTKVADKIFRKEENLYPTASLSQDYFFKNGQFSLNDNYLITPVGIDFLYNPTEIKPFAAGTTTITIPYGQIKTLLKPNTITAQYLK